MGIFKVIIVMNIHMEWELHDLFNQYLVTNITFDEHQVGFIFS